MPTNYHLNRQGQDLGIFALDELRRRRDARELTGEELVWCEGMPAWQTLNRVLAPERARKSNRTVVWVVGVIVVILLGLAIGGGLLVAKSFRYLRTLDGTGETSRSFHHESKGSAIPLITVSTNTLTVAKVNKIRKQFRVREWLEAYQQCGNNDARSLQYINDWLACEYDEDSKIDPLQLAKLGDEVAANQESTDPAILTLTAAKSVELFAATNRLERALALFPQSKYRAYPQFYATVLMTIDLNQVQDNHPRVPELDLSALHLFKKCFSDGSFRPEDQDEIASVLVDGWGYNFFYRNRAAVRTITSEAGEPYRWLALMLDGEYHIMEAWEVRGGGYANTVKPEGWKGFEEHLAQARKSLTAAWKLNPKEPLAAARMITVSMGDSGLDEMQKWFDRSTRAQIDFPDAWRNLRWGIRPRWGGSLEAMEDFGIMAINTGRFDTDVPRKFFDIVSDLEDEADLPFGEHLYGRKDIWPQMQRMYEGYIAEPRQLKDRDGWRTAYTVVAFLAGKYDVARAQLEQLNWQPRTNVIARWSMDLSLMPQEVAARTGSARKEVIDAEGFARSGRISKALELYQNLVRRNDLDDRTRAFVQSRTNTLGFERRLAKGEWVDFLPAVDADPNWIYSRGQARRLPDGSLEVESDPNGHILYCRSRVGSRFEVRGEFEVLRSSTPDFQAGLVIGKPHFDSYTWYSFRMKRNSHEGQLVTYARHWGKSQIKHSLDLNDGTNSFSFRYEDGRATASVNGTEVFQQAIPKWKINVPPEEIQLGLGAFNDVNTTVIRYRNLQVRRLTKADNSGIKPD